MNDSPHDEPLLDCLAELPAGAWDLPTGDDVLRQRLLAQTAGIVRARGRRRQARRWAGFALAYAAGIATAAAVLWQRPGEIPQPLAGHIAEETADEDMTHDQANDGAAVAVASDSDRANETASPATTADEDPVALRRRVAGAPTAEQIALLRRAGDLYLGRYGDLESALDCYRQVLELTPPAERGQFDAGDSWLLAELKHAQVAATFAASDPQ